MSDGLQRPGSFPLAPCSSAGVIGVFFPSRIVREPAYLALKDLCIRGKHVLKSPRRGAVLLSLILMCYFEAVSRRETAFSILSDKLMRISATIITLNEEMRLARCLESIQGIADEIIVVDSESVDNTREIAESHGARVFGRQWTNYSDQKNFASRQASHDWILSLDADECLSSSLREALVALKKGNSLAEAYAFRRLAFYLGRWIYHSGWYPDYKTRLYLKEKAHWEGQFVHETLVVDGRISRIEADLLHYTCESVSAHARSVERYTTLAAQDLWTLGRRSTFPILLGSALGAFMKGYLLERGFLDGMQGCLIATFAGYYNFLKYAKLWELERKKPEDRRKLANRK